MQGGLSARRWKQTALFCSSCRKGCAGNSRILAETPPRSWVWTVLVQYYWAAAMVAGGRCTNACVKVKLGEETSWTQFHCAQREVRL